MPRIARFEKQSEGDYYHVTARGAGRRTIFDDDADHAKYLDLLFALIDASPGSLVAWCLMDNHIHLLFHLAIHDLSALIQRLHTSYAQHYNGRHGHVGPVFQKRFDSSPIDDHDHLLLAVKYIHQNPIGLGNVDWKTYLWSSYRGYVDGLTHCETETVLDLLGGPEGFRQFHEANFNVAETRLDGYRRRLNDAEAKQILEQRLGHQYADTLAALSKKERDPELASLYGLGLSARQIERLTGIGRSIVNRAVKNE